MGRSPTPSSARHSNSPGPNLYAGRIFSLIASLATVSLLAWIVAPGATSFYFWVSWILLFGVNVRVINYFAESRPDMLAAMFSVLAVILFYRNKFVPALGFSHHRILFQANRLRRLPGSAGGFFLERNTITAKRRAETCGACRRFSFSHTCPVVDGAGRLPLYGERAGRQYPVPPILLAQNAADLMGTFPLFLSPWRCGLL